MALRGHLLGMSPSILATLFHRTGAVATLFLSPVLSTQPREDDGGRGCTERWDAGSARDKCPRPGH